MSAPTQIDDDWNDWTFDHCLFCDEPATVHGYVRLFGPVGEPVPSDGLHYRTTWVRAGWCEAEECAADRMDTTYLPRERAAESAANLAAAVYRAEREATSPIQGEQ